MPRNGPWQSIIWFDKARNESVWKQESRLEEMERNEGLIAKPSRRTSTT